MAQFEDGQLMIVGFCGAGGVPVLLGVQEAACPIHALTSPFLGAWPQATLKLGNIPSGTLRSVFKVQGFQQDGTIQIDQAALVGKTAILNAFLSASDLTVKLDDANQFIVHLRAVLTQSFLLNGAQAQATYPTGVTGPLVSGTGPGGPDPLSAYVPCFATGPVGGPYQDDPSLTPATLELNAIGLPPDPIPPANPAMHLRLQRTFTFPGGGSSYTKESVLGVNLFAPTELAVLMDRSNRMLDAVSPTRNLSALSVDLAHMLNNVMGKLIPDRFLPGSTVPLKNSFKLGFFSFRDTGLDAGTISRAPGDPITSFGAPPSTTSVSAIGRALAEVKGRFTAGRGRLRQVLLLTDGYESASSPGPLLDELDATTFPSRSESPDQGIIARNISVALAATYWPSFATTITDHEGRFDASVPDHTSAAAFRASLLNRLPDIWPLGVCELPVPTASTVTVVLEPGSEKAILLATEANPGGAPLALTAWPAGAPNPSVAAQNESDFCYSWLLLASPKGGSHTVTNVPPGSRLFVIYDVAIRTDFEARSAGLGRPLHLRAELTYNSEPISDATVTARVTVPTVSLGQTLTDFVREGGLVRSVLNGAVEPTQFVNASLREEPGALQKSEGKSSAQANPENQTPAYRAPSVREQLTEAWTRTSNTSRLGEEFVVQLHECKPGIYEATVPSSKMQREGNVIVDFRAESDYPSPFARTGRTSVALESVPSAAESKAVSFRRAGAPILDLVPHNELGLPLGPGLASLFEFRATDRNGQVLPFRVRDLHNGTYRAEVPAGFDKERYRTLKKPEFVYRKGSYSKSIPIDEVPSLTEARRVRVILEQLQVLDTNDSCWLESGEFLFFTNVIPSASPLLAQSTKVTAPYGRPISLEARDILELGKTIFDEVVPCNGELTIGLLGLEVDFPFYPSSTHSLTKYTRRIPLDGKPRVFRPDDEVPTDQEDMTDWRVWYRIEYLDAECE